MGFSKSFYIVAFAVLGVAIFIGFKYIPSSRYIYFIGSGTSMEPTFFDGDELKVDTKSFPEKGDAIVFDCVSCEGYNSPNALTKRIHDIDQRGCYWLIGDNMEISFDSRTIGWLCPGIEIEVYGVVVGANDK